MTATDTTDAIDSTTDNAGQGRGQDSGGDPGQGPALDLIAAVEAVVFSAERAVDPARIADALGEGATPHEVVGAIAELNDAYDEQGRAFRIERVAGGYRVMTRVEHASVVSAFHRGKGSSRLSRAALETLSIIAYRQPVTRASLEAIRGVACGEVLRALLERRLVTIKGRAEELGRPMLYGTTKQFLDAFGLASLRDLPDIGDERNPIRPPFEADDAEDGAEVGPEAGPEPGTETADDAAHGFIEPQERFARELPPQRGSVGSDETPDTSDTQHDEQEDTL